MTSTRRSCPLTFRLISRSTLPGADVCPLSGVVRNRYAADDAAAPAAITPLMKLRRDGLLGLSSTVFMSSIAGSPRSGELLLLRQAKMPAAALGMSRNDSPKRLDLQYLRRAGGLKP